MPTPAEVAEKLRGDIERDHNAARDAAEKQYIEDKEELERLHREDLKIKADEKIQAFLSVGLNSDGTDPMGRPTG